MVLKVQGCLNKMFRKLQSLPYFKLSHKDLEGLEAVTVQISGDGNIGNQELEHTPQKPSASEPDQTDPEKNILTMTQKH